MGKSKVSKAPQRKPKKIVLPPAYVDQIDKQTREKEIGQINERLEEERRRKQEEEEILQEMRRLEEQQKAIEAQERERLEKIRIQTEEEERVKREKLELERQARLLRQRKCGHDYCSLSGRGECCSCGDGRPKSYNGYRIYVDGKGFQMTASRGTSYCEPCKVSESYKPIRPPSGWEQKGCGHNFCITFDKATCCHCGDLREGDHFPVYVDGLGWGFHGEDKSIHYCSGCREPAEVQQVSNLLPKFNSILLKEERETGVGQYNGLEEQLVEEEALSSLLNSVGLNETEINQALVAHHLELGMKPSLEDVISSIVRRNKAEEMNLKKSLEDLE